MVRRVIVTLPSFHSCLPEAGSVWGMDMVSHLTYYFDLIRGSSVWATPSLRLLPLSGVGERRGGVVGCGVMWGLIEGGAMIPVLMWCQLPCWSEGSLGGAVAALMTAGCR